MSCFRRFWFKETRHPETVSDEKLYLHCSMRSNASRMTELLNLKSPQEFVSRFAILLVVYKYLILHDGGTI